MRRHKLKLLKGPLEWLWPLRHLAECFICHTPSHENKSVVDTGRNCGVQISTGNAIYCHTRKPGKSPQRDFKKA